MHEDARKTLTSVRVLFGALAGGIVLFASVVTWLLTTGAHTPTSPELASTFLPIVGIVTVVALLVAPVVQRQALNAAASESLPSEAALNRFLTSAIVGLALREGPALLALVMALLTGELRWGLAITGIVLIAMVLALPTESALRSYLRSVERGGPG